MLGSKTTVSSTTGNETRAAAAEEQAAVEAPPTSPLIEEIEPANPVREAMEDAEAERQAGGLGHPGRPLNARSPFMIGMKAAAGVAVTYALVELFLKARGVLVLIGDAIFTKVGGYVLGNVITSFIAGFGTFLWMLAWGIPYPALLGLLIFILDLIPVIGSTVGGAIVTLVALTVSIPVAVATLIFYIAYRLAEDYLLVPRIIGHTVKVPLWAAWSPSSSAAWSWASSAR